MKRLIAGLVCGWGLLAGAAEPYDAALEYIESDGTQYLDTGLVLSNDVAVTLDISLMPGVTQGQIFGGRASSEAKNISVFFVYGDQLYLDFNDGDCSTYRQGSNAARLFEERLHLELSAERRAIAYDSGYLEPAGANTNRCEATFCIDSSAQIFGVRGGDLNWVGRIKARLYGLKITKGEEVLRDYQPCVKDGVVGLYDRATQTFLPPAAGILAAGPVIVTPAADRSASGDDMQLARAEEDPLADGPVDYIESDGTAYLDTRVTLTSAMSVDLVYALLSPRGQNTVGVFGSRSAATSQNIALSVLYDDNPSTRSLTADFSNTSSYSNYRVQMKGFETNDIHRTHLGGDKCMTRDLETARQQVAGGAWDGHGEFSTPGSAYIFKTQGTTWGNAPARLYALTIRENGAIIHDYQPWRTNGVAVLYDKTTGDFLGNANTQGALRAGAPIRQPLFAVTQTNACPRVALSNVGETATDLYAVTTFAPVYDRAVEYIESDGTQYMDTGLVLSNDVEVTITYAVMDYSNGAAGVFGSRISADSCNVAISYAATTQISCDFVSGGDYGKYRASLSPTTAGKIYTSILSAQKRTLGDYANNTPMPVTDWCTPGNAFIFGTQNTKWNYAKARLYGLVIRRGDELLRDYQPCVKNGHACLYERVSGTFLDNVAPGGHAFTAGPTVPAPDTDYPDAVVRARPRNLAFTNLVLSVADGVTVRSPIEPLQPGTRYACTFCTRDATTGELTALAPGEGAPFVFETEPETVPADAAQSLGVTVTTLKGGKVGLDVTRKESGETKLHLLRGPRCGDATVADWATDEVIATLAAGESDVSLVSPVLNETDAYIRLYTEDGEWSRVVQTTGIVRPPRGIVVIFR